MKFKDNKWFYLITLSLVWGSSFILMKKALRSLTPVEVGALRILISGLVILPFGYKDVIKIDKKQWKWVVLSALSGTFIPVFLLTYAIMHIDSSIASILNTLTPFNALIIGFLFFGFSFNTKQISGILFGLLGALILIYQGINLNPNQNYIYAVLPLLASVGYAFNVNIIKRHLQEVNPLAITTGHFVVATLPALLILFYSNFFESISDTSENLNSMLYVAILAVFGTAIAKVMFNKMIHISSTIFSTSVTYTIPIIAVIWGVLDGEKLSFLQLIAALIIILGVWLVNKAKS